MNGCMDGWTGEHYSFCHSNLNTVLWSLVCHPNPHSQIKNKTLPRLDNLMIVKHLNTHKKNSQFSPSKLQIKFSSVATPRYLFCHKHHAFLPEGFWALPSHNALCPCQEPVPVATPIALNICPDPFYSFLWAFLGPLCKTHSIQGSSSDIQNPCLSFSFHSSPQHSGEPGGAWTKTFADGRGFPMLAVTTVYNGFLLKCLTFYSLFVDIVVWYSASSLFDFITCKEPFNVIVKVTSEFLRTMHQTASLSMECAKCQYKSIKACWLPFRRWFFHMYMRSFVALLSHTFWTASDKLE